MRKINCVKKKKKKIITMERPDKKEKKCKFQKVINEKHSYYEMKNN